MTALHLIKNKTTNLHYVYPCIECRKSNGIMYTVYMWLNTFPPNIVYTLIVTCYTIIFSFAFFISAYTCRLGKGTKLRYTRYTPSRKLLVYHALFFSPDRGEGCILCTFPEVLNTFPKKNKTNDAFYVREYDGCIPINR